MPPRLLARIILQINVNPDNAPTLGGSHVGPCLLTLLCETAWPSRASRATQDN